MMSRIASRNNLLSLTTFAALILSLLVSVPVYAQVTGATLQGTVTDASGAAVPNANISIKNTATGITRDVTTDLAGFYSAPNLSPSVYDVTASAPGFSSKVETGLTLTVGAQQVLDVSLQVGQVTEKVQVTSEAPTVQLASSAISAEVNSTTVRELPLNGRDWTALATLQPGVIGIRSQLGTTGTVNRGNRGFGNQLATGGHRPTENTYRINGINVNDYVNGAPGSVAGYQLGVDAIQEFSVLTTNYSAEYGRTSGGVINAVLKPGANSFHGDAYWFLRSKVLDARNFFDKNLPPFHRNQWGGSAGGPIKKDRTFVFGDFEAIRMDKSLSSFVTVPSVNARNGLLASGQLPNIAADPNGMTNGVDNVVLKYLPLFPLPDPSLGSGANGDTGHVATSPLLHYTENYFTARVDHKISDKDSIDGVGFYNKSPQDTPDAMLGAIHETLSFRSMIGLEETHVFGPALVNTARIGFDRSIGLVGHPVKALNPLAGDTSLGVGLGRAAPIIVIQGDNLSQEQTTLGNQSTFTHLQNSYQAYDDAFLTRGLHSIKFGGAFERLQSDILNVNRPNGTFTFSSLQDFLQNNPKSLSIGNFVVGHMMGMRQSFFGGYVQDDWRFRPNLTVNVGVRYEPATLISENHNAFLVVHNVYGGPRVADNHLWDTNPTLKNFAPRVGFSWDPFRNGKTAVRGGFGIFDVLPGPWYAHGGEGGSYPFALGVSGPTSRYSFAIPAATSLGANATASNVNASNIANAQAYAPESAPKNNYSMNWNLNVQREITPTLTAMLGYVGMHSVHSPFTTDQSNMTLPLTPGGDMWPVTPGAVVDPNVGALRPGFWMVSSHYNGLQAQITKRMSHGLQAQGSYTWGKCIDDSSSGTIGDPFQNSFTTTMFFLRGASRRGLCDFNIAHNLVANYIWEVPTPKSFGTVAEHILGGWQVGGILTLSTGIPTTPWIGGDPLGLINNDAAVYPDHVAGCDPVNHSYRNDVKGSSYINLNCYTVPVAPASIASDPTKCVPYPSTTTPNTCQQLFGNAGRNSVVGPGSSNFDFSLFKNNYVRRISETFNVQFRAEFFNIFNHANFLLPNFNEGNNQIFNGNGSTNPAVIDNTGTYDPRQIQFSLKIIW
jgi:hypothetical protein